MAPEPSGDLRAARRALDGLSGITLLDEWRWHEGPKRFALRLAIDHEGKSDVLVPRRSEWFVTASASYPRGSIKIFPSASHGLTATFRHQSYNGKPATNKAWRDGDICVRSTVQILGRTGIDGEPTDAGHRLRWNVQRARTWLSRAADDSIASAGEPFELPTFPSTAGKRPYVAFWEDESTFSKWSSSAVEWGNVGFREGPGRTPTLVVDAHDMPDNMAVISHHWGDLIARGTQRRGIWVRLRQPPVMPPWQVPSTWDELLSICSKQGRDISRILANAPPTMESDEVILLIGFPFPIRIGESDSRYHWQGIKLPPLRVKPPGVARRRVQHHLRIDPSRALTGDIAWLPSHNWAPSELNSRGQLPEWVRSSHVVVLGIGAVGSVLAELLVRGGVHDLTLIDDEHVEAGNLARHALTLADLKANKAERMADRLRMVSPHTRVAVIAETPGAAEWQDLDRTHEHLLILDCTANNDAAHGLADASFRASTRFGSISFGLRANPLYVFTAEGQRFPAMDMLRALEPHLMATAAETREEDLPREGAGCWHPIFPARADEVTQAVSMALSMIATDFGPHGLRVADLRTSG